MASTRFLRSVRLPLILQAEVAGCGGLACLAMIAFYPGLRTDLAALRGSFSTSLNDIRMVTLAAYPQRLN